MQNNILKNIVGGVIFVLVAMGTFILVTRATQNEERDHNACDLEVVVCDHEIEKYQAGE